MVSCSAKARATLLVVGGHLPAGRDGCAGRQRGQAEVAGAHQGRLGQQSGQLALPDARLALRRGRRPPRARRSAAPAGRRWHFPMPCPAPHPRPESCPSPIAHPGPRLADPIGTGPAVDPAPSAGAPPSAVGPCRPSPHRVKPEGQSPQPGGAPTARVRGGADRPRPHCANANARPPSPAPPGPRHPSGGRLSDPPRRQHPTAATATTAAARSMLQPHPHLARPGRPRNHARPPRMTEKGARGMGDGTDTRMMTGAREARLPHFLP